VLKTAKKDDLEKNPKDPKGDFPEAHTEVNYIYGGPDSYESKRKQKFIARKAMAVSPATPEYQKWSEVPITFDCSDHPDFIPKPGRYSLIVCPIVKDVKLNRVLVDGGSSLNILFLKIFDQMGLSRSALRPNRATFHDIVTGTAATPVGQITLLVIFGTQENFCTEHLQFKEADFKTVYNTFLGWPTITKFMAVSHYAYLVLKMPGQHGVISIRGDIKHAYNCDKESYEMANRLTTSVELQELKKAFAKSPPPPRTAWCHLHQGRHHVRLRL
jgi:hypothetical protein